MKYLRWLLVVCFIVVLSLGWKYPLIGLLVIPMIGGGMIFAFINGRWFCGNLCPRGLFLESMFSKVTPKRNISRFFLHPIFRWTFLAIFMGKMGYSLFGVYQDGITLDAVSSAFWWSMFGSSIIALVGGFVYNSRFWCSVCPVGTVGKTVKGVANKKYTVSDSCKECGACTKVCSFGHNPADHKGGEFLESDCIQCGKCITACKFGAIKKAS